ncbi:MAG: ATP-binding protein [Bacteroidota bacterium]
MSSQSDTKNLLFKQISLDSDPNVVHTVESLIDEIRNQFDFKEDVYGNVMIAVTEAVNNGIIHGNKMDQSKQIHIDIEKKNDFRLLVRVRDEGEGFDHTTLKDPTAPENLENIGGRGVFLMTHLADELNFSDEGRVVEMIFNI